MLTYVFSDTDMPLMVKQIMLNLSSYWFRLKGYCKV